MGRAWVTAIAVAVATVGIPAIAHAAPTPGPTLTSPANGAIITGGQPTFSGTASILPLEQQQVTVGVCKGFVSACQTGGVERLTAAVNSSTGHYSAPANPALADGKYTAQSEQDDIAQDQGFSSPVTFTVHNNPPVVRLNSPGSKPLLTARPTLTGLAETLPGDSNTVGLDIYAGNAATGTPVRSVSGSRSSGGSFSIKVTPALADGQYTAVARQGDSGGITGHSHPQTFRIKVHAPVVTLAQPADHAQMTAPMLVLSGQAGTALGDVSKVIVVLYRGAQPAGRPLTTTVTAAVSGGSWSTPGPQRLAPGVYTAVATQRDDAGHTGRSNPRTFRIVPVPHVIGPVVKLDRRGFASVRIGCTAVSGDCTGDVLVLTTGRFQPVPGGPTGRLRVMFAYVSIPAGQTMLVRRTVASEVAHVLRRNQGATLRVTVTLSPAGRSITALRRLHVGP